MNDGTAWDCTTPEKWSSSSSNACPVGVSIGQARLIGVGNSIVHASYSGLNANVSLNVQRLSGAGLFRVVSVN
jgi:hypothetical protein